MILFLDDNPNRAAVAYQRMLPSVRDRVIWCQTAEEAIKTLEDYRTVLELVMLDHDLGGEEFVNSKREDCGMEIIRFLEKYSHQEPEKFETFIDIKFIIHSWNKPAGLIMGERLQKLGIKYVKYQPFGSGGF